METAKKQMNHAAMRVRRLVGSQLSRLDARRMGDAQRARR
jgi:hypothetical protein